MDMNQFTTARADQHRADLMTAAQRARDERIAKAAGRTRRRLRFWRPPRAITLAMPQLPLQLPEGS
jgi:hypothetical protein